MIGIATVLSSSLVTSQTTLYLGTVRINGMLEPQMFLLFVGISLLSIGTWLIVKAFK